MDESGNGQIRTVQQTFRTVLTVFGIVIFVVLASKGVSQADDRKYVEGQPHLWNKTYLGMAMSKLQIQKVSTASSIEVAPEKQADRVKKSTSSIDRSTDEQRSLDKNTNPGRAAEHTPELPDAVPAHAKAQESIQKGFEVRERRNL